ncbi:FHA domain-containing protein [Microbacterium arborescens]|uniref:FHA domain-containing protein n=1 Tax=Microbacterium TaxID=33882 RepID=UPI0025A26C14|nr:FHA domain-containing protein [Microbacterium arborescens]WJM14538.1 FHA domain-containing protein [Microbacterium arborescens]
MFRYPTPDDAHGAGFAMVTDRFALLLGPGAGEALAAAVWEAMTARDAAFEDVLSVIAAVGIGSLPDLALVELVDAGSSAVSVAVRGGATIDLHGPQRSSYAGTGVGTWVEGSAQHVAGISLGLGAAPGPSVLPIGRGVVRTDALEWGAAAPAAVASPAVEVATVASPAIEAPEDAAPLETVAVDRRTLTPSFGPRRSSQPVAGPAASPAPVPAPVPTPPQPEMDDSTVLGSRRGAAPVAEAPASRRYVLRLEPGGEYPLDHPIVLGRAPRAAQHPGARIIAVPSPRKEVSGTHVEVRLEDDVLVVRDLGSTNGTIVRDASGDVGLLRSGATSRVSPGAVLDLGDGVLASFESPS